MLFETKYFLSKKFDMKDLSEASYVICIELYRDRSRGILDLSQKAYIEKMLKHYNIQNCSPSVTPIIKGDKFSKFYYPKNDLDRAQMKQISYASVVESLMYAQVCTHPDIAFIVGMLGRYQIDTGMDRWKAAKKILRCLQGTKNICLLSESQTTFRLLVIQILIFLVVLTARNPHQVTYSCLQGDQFHERV
jgi:Reverse transcriptase (RNA-dependent DNA polymerase)